MVFERGMKSGYPGPQQNGFTLFEVVVVVCIISILAVFALDRYCKLLVDVERTTMEYTLGVMRSALHIQYAELYLAGKLDQVGELVQANPMDHLAERPANFLDKEVSGHFDQVDPGTWLFNGATRQYISGVSLKELEPYSWISPWNKK